MEKELYFGYKLKEGTNIDNAISKIKEELATVFKQGLEYSVAKAITDIVDRKKAGYDYKRINNALYREYITFSFNEKIDDICNQLEVFKKSIIDSYTLTTFCLDNGKTLLKLNFQRDYLPERFSLEDTIEKFDFIEVYTNIKDDNDEDEDEILDNEPDICGEDWKKAFSLSLDKIRVTNLLDYKDVITINYNNVENLIENKFEKRVKNISVLKIYDIFELKKKTRAERFHFCWSDEYQRVLKEQMDTERPNLEKHITVNSESTVNDLLNQI